MLLKICESNSAKTHLPFRSTLLKIHAQLKNVSKACYRRNSEPFSKRFSKAFKPFIIETVRTGTMNCELNKPGN